VPRVGHDTFAAIPAVIRSGFNPRAPCGARQGSRALCEGGSMFQSTCPVWGTTAHYVQRCSRRRFQSTCPVWGTTVDTITETGGTMFQSTCPVWGTTVMPRMSTQLFRVSIHVPRVGHDPARSDKRHQYREFQSTCPV